MSTNAHDTYSASLNLLSQSGGQLSKYETRRVNEVRSPLPSLQESVSTTSKNMKKKPR